MLITIPDVLTAEELAQARSVLDSAEWVDGKVTAGYQAQAVKENLQLPEEHPAAKKLGEMVLAALARSPFLCLRPSPSGSFRRCSTATQVEVISERMSTLRSAPSPLQASAFGPMFLQLSSSPLPINTMAANCLWKILMACTVSS